MSRKLARKILTSLFPNYFFNQLRFELHMLWVRVFHKKTIHDSNMLINIGSGTRSQPGWVNIDGFKDNNVDVLCDIRTKLPFLDNSVRGIFCEHVLEHIDYDEDVPTFLAECHRVLKPGGTIRIIVPDAGRYLMAYSTNGWEELKIMRPLTDELVDSYFREIKYSTKMELVNMIFRQFGEHKFAYDSETLITCPGKANFVNVEQSSFNNSRDIDVCIDTPKRQSESLYVEASKNS